MTVAAPPKSPPVQPDPQALIEEARRRTRRRRLKYAGAGIAALLMGGGIYAGLEATGGSPAVQAVPPGFHLVKARGPVSYAVLRYLPSRFHTLDLETGETAAAEQMSEVWWDPKTGLTRRAGRIGSQRFGASCAISAWRRVSVLRLTRGSWRREACAGSPLRAAESS